MGDAPADGPPAGHESADLSLQEAARLYEVPLRTLGNRVRWGEIDAYKARGPWGYEWRVSTQALEAFGYQRRRVPDGTSEGAPDPRVVELERELAAARRSVAAERHKAEEADRRLGAARLESGRLRATLAAEVARRERAEAQTAALPAERQPGIAIDLTNGTSDSPQSTQPAEAR